ncbi:ER-derived vesicles protein erv46 [Tilletia horrida]|uniref:ER-derived vesicles protein erv46 n=1 Tax=Tilletia horrida TaxID=155126 RepID=A0AAN6GLU1_9BASI|nr:ER-derived vesicles protein erv46 [Tilletia horrida]KAK0550104.1 ER-derived vesicles protein erv46 [Tilletia horrida]KAK0562456.1 ER-derived vesicles protein erv46 [Tilletia horrida]
MAKGGGVFNRLRGIDAFGRTMDDVRIRTSTGAFLTFLSAFLILILTISEFRDYRRVHVKSSLVVDLSRGERITANLNITFPRVPCYLLSLDVMDISGETQSDIHQDVQRTRLSSTGEPISEGSRNAQGEAARLAKTRGPNYCGSCYGGEPPANGCCNSCDEVREAYVRRGWSFVDPDHIDQCIQEHWTEKIFEQNSEGCNVAGKIHVNKVVGNFHLSPGRAFQKNTVMVHDLVPYLANKGNSHHDFGHIIHSFGFGSAAEFDTVDWVDHYKKKGAKIPPVKGKSELSKISPPLKKLPDGIIPGSPIKARLGVVDPLAGTRAHTEVSDYMFQYFLKVVPTEYRTLSGEELRTHQYSVTSYERDLDPAHNAAALASGLSPKAQQAGGGPGGGAAHPQVLHGFMGVPGVFINYEISALKVVQQENKSSLGHFFTSTCAIVGGILTVAGLLDGLIYTSRIRMGGAESNGHASHGGLGYARQGGKFL